MDGYRVAYIYNHGQFAGILEETAFGYSFAYNIEYLANDFFPAISLTLPKRSEGYQSMTLFSFFDGLIPEGWILDNVSRKWGIPLEDRFGLLIVACRDCIGSVSVRKAKE